MKFEQLAESLVNDKKINKTSRQERKRELISKDHLRSDMYKHIPITDRSAETYYRLFNLENPDDISKYFKDKVVLDLGAGAGEFVNDLNRKRITEKAFAVDFLYGIVSEDIIHTGDDAERGKFPLKEQRICARVEDLPIENNSVDIAVASKSLPLYAETKEDIVDFFNELVRVLKPGGEARVSPVKNFNQWMAKPANLKEKLFPKKRIPEVDRWTSEREAERLGFSSGYEYRVSLRDKYNKVEEWTKECLSELEKDPNIEIEIIGLKNFKAVPGLRKEKDTLVIRKKL